MWIMKHWRNGSVLEDFNQRWMVEVGSMETSVAVRWMVESKAEGQVNSEESEEGQATHRPEHDMVE